MFHEPCKTTLKVVAQLAGMEPLPVLIVFSFNFQKNGESKRPTGNSLGLQQSKR
jgi:hypothetical protein